MPAQIAIFPRPAHGRPQSWDLRGHIPRRRGPPDGSSSPWHPQPGAEQGPRAPGDRLGTRPEPPPRRSPCRSPASRTEPRLRPRDSACGASHGGWTLPRSADRRHDPPVPVVRRERAGAGACDERLSRAGRGRVPARRAVGRARRPDERRLHLVGGPVGRRGRAAPVVLLERVKVDMLGGEGLGTGG